MARFAWAVELLYSTKKHPETSGCFYYLLSSDKEKVREEQGRSENAHRDYEDQIGFLVFVILLVTEALLASAFFTTALLGGFLRSSGRSFLLCLCHFNSFFMLFDKLYFHYITLMLNLQEFFIGLWYN